MSGLDHAVASALLGMAMGVSTGCSSGGEVVNPLPVDAGSDARGGDSGADAKAGDSSAGTENGRLYVTMMGADEITVIDEASGTVSDHIPVGKSPAILLATPDHTKLYSANWGDNSLSSVDVATHAVRSIALDSRPWVEAMSHDGKHVYAGLGSNSVAVIGTATDTIERSMSFDALPASLILSPDGATLYVAELNNTIEAVSEATGAVVHAAIPVGSAPAWITISPDGSKVYTLNFTSGDVSVVDTASWTVTATVAVGSSSYGIVGTTTPDGSLLCISDYGSADATAIDTKTNKVVWTLPVDGRPVSIGFRADGTRGYVGDYGHDSLSVPVSALLNALSSGTILQVTGMGRITAFDPKTGKRIGQPTTVGPGPSSLVVLPP